MTSGLETSDSRIVISSEALKSLSFAFKWSMSGTPKREACYLKPSGIAPPVEPSEPVEPASPLSQTIKGRHALGANPEPLSLY